MKGSCKTELGFFLVSYYFRDDDVEKVKAAYSILQSNFKLNDKKRKNMFSAIRHRKMMFAPLDHTLPSSLVDRSISPLSSWAALFLAHHFIHALPVLYAPWPSDLFTFVFQHLLSTSVRSSSAMSPKETAEDECCKFEQVDENFTST
jgi:hypothetical protein